MKLLRSLREHQHLDTANMASRRFNYYKRSIFQIAYEFACLGWGIALFIISLLIYVTVGETLFGFIPIHLGLFLISCEVSILIFTYIMKPRKKLEDVIGWVRFFSLFEPEAKAVLKILKQDVEKMKAFAEKAHILSKLQRRKL